MRARGRLGRITCVGAWLAVAGCVASGAALAQAGDGWAQRIAVARDAIGVDPAHARALIASLRRDAMARGRLEPRIQADEIECRLLTDLDPGEAVRVADAGIAAARAADMSADGLPMLRLRACRASMLHESGDTAGALRELEAVATAASGPALAPARGLALLERGVIRSRTGQLSLGQDELLAACRLLEPQPRDHELCLAHLVNHYRRVGDYDEALALGLRLRDEARRRGAVFDESVYVSLVAQVRQLRGDHREALVAFADAVRFAERTQDRVGLQFALRGIAASLLVERRPAEALAKIEQAHTLLDGAGDHRERLRVGELRAEVLNALERHAEAQQQLVAIEADVRKLGDAVLLAGWLLADAQAHRGLGQWRDALQSLEAWREIDGRLQADARSLQSARLRMQFNRERDAQEVEAMRQLAGQQAELRRTQALALGLAVLLLGVLLGLAVHRLRQARGLQVLASTDELTGLPNRRALLAHADAGVREARQRGEPLGLLMVDVDHFKQINDRHGHARGDEVLRHIARVLPGGLRGRDRLGRLGGEEFVAVLPGANAQQSVAVAERMREAIAATPLIGPTGELRFTVSIGVAELAAGEGARELIARADAALYAAKQAGRNAVVQADATAA